MLKTSLLTPLGRIILIADSGNLVYCNWDSPDCQQKLVKIIKFYSTEKSSEKDNEVLIEATKQIKEYLAGRRQTFEIPYRVKGTEFQKRVWNGIANVSYGETISYKELTQRCGGEKGFRAVASACGANPIAIIIPCHRIISASGEPGGYTGGIDKKLALLEIEKKKGKMK